MYIFRWSFFGPAHVCENDLLLNSVQLFGIVLLGGLCAGEVSRRVLALPRTTGYVVFGLLLGQSGLKWITRGHIESAQLFIDLALGLILFELGYMVPRTSASTSWNRLKVGSAISLFSATAIAVTLAAWGFPLKTSIFAATLCLATSPAITIATTSDVGAKGDNSGLLLTLVAINGSLAFAGVTWATSALAQSQGYFSGDVLAGAIQKILRSVALGAGCAAVVLRGAKRLGRHSDHQHLLIIGTIVFGVGMALSLDLSVFFPMLVFGYLTKILDRKNSVVAIRIASDARIFLVITFVLAGAALDIGLVPRYWPVAVSIVVARFAAQFLTLRTCRNVLGMTPRVAGFAAIGLQPMSSVALVLLSSTQSLYGTLEADLAGSLMATILLLQLIGPLATQTAILGFGEATHLNRDRFGQNSSTPESA